MSSQSNLYIIIAVIVLIIIGGGLYFLGTNAEQTNQNNVVDIPENNVGNTENNTDTNDSVETVTYTDTGFDPETITITQGETVRFVNESSNPMWVASDVHPTHTHYAGTSLSEHCDDGASNDAFDQCDVSDSYTFIFDKIGTWDYHNHVIANDQGSVIVE